MFRTWAEALAGYKASEAEVSNIERQLIYAYKKGREDMAREIRDLIGVKDTPND